MQRLRVSLLFQLLVERLQSSLEHGAVRGRARRGEVGRRAGARELQRPPPGLPGGIFGRRRTAGGRLAPLAVLLLRLDRLALPTSCQATTSEVFPTFFVGESLPPLFSYK